MRTVLPRARLATALACFTLGATLAVADHSPPHATAAAARLRPNVIAQWHLIGAATITAANPVGVPPVTPEETAAAYDLDMATLHVAMYDALALVSARHKPFKARLATATRCAAIAGHAPGARRRLHRAGHAVSLAGRAVPATVRQRALPGHGRAAAGIRPRRAGGPADTGAGATTTVDSLRCRRSRMVPPRDSSATWARRPRRSTERVLYILPFSMSSAGQFRRRRTALTRQRALRRGRARNAVAGRHHQHRPHREPDD